MIQLGSLVIMTTAEYTAIVQAERTLRQITNTAGAVLDELAASPAVEARNLREQILAATPTEGAQS